MANNLFAPPTSQELRQTMPFQQVEPKKDLFAPPTKDELAQIQSPEQKGLLGQAGDAALGAIDAVGRTVSRYSAAPTRAAFGAAQSGEDPFKAFGKQFGEDPDQAPTGKQIMQRGGVSDVPISELYPKIYDEGPGSKQDFWSLKLKKGGLMDPSLSGLLGAGVDIAADPTNLIPVEGVAKGLLKGATKLIPESKAVALASKAEKVAAKATGASTSEIEALLKKKKLGAVGRAALDAKIEGSGGKLEPVLRGGNDSADLLARVEELKSQTGEKIGEAYKGVEKHVNDPAFYDSLNEEQKMKLIGSSINPQEFSKEMRLKFESELPKEHRGSEALQQIEKDLADLESRGSNLSIPEALKIKKGMDKNIKHMAMEQPLYKEALNSLARGLQEKITNHVDALAEVTGGTTGKELKELNQSYHAASLLENMATKQEARGIKNQFLGLTEKAAIGGGLFGAASSSDPEEALKRAGAGLLGAAGSKMLKSYGNIGLARSLDNIAKSKIAVPLTRGKTEGLLKAAQVLSTQKKKDKQ